MGFRLISKTVLAEGWGKLSEYLFDHKRRDGTWQQLSREVYIRGPFVACLLHNPKNDHVLLTRQFRLPSIISGRDATVIEVPAGALDNIDPKARMIAELEEETGYRVKKIEQIFNLLMSPGATDETGIFFIGTYDVADQISDGGGLKDEGEDIEVLEMPFDVAFMMIETGEIYDAKTVILLQHLALQRL